MEFTDFNDLFTTVLGNVERVNIVQKGLSVVITLVLLLICLKINDFVLKRIFRTHKKDLTVAEEKRIITLRHASETFMHATLYIVALLMILSYFIDVGALLAVAGVGTLAIGFGAQGLVEDLMSGFVIIWENQFCVGDYVTFDNNHYGVVESIGVRTTSIRELDGGLYIIHNGKIDRLINHSKGTIKAIVDVGVAYEENIDHVVAVLSQICEEVYNANNELFIGKPEVLGVTRMDPSAMNIRIIADEDAARKVKAETALRKRIKEVFDAQGIEIPYSKYVVYKDPDQYAKVREERSHGSL